MTIHRYEVTDAEWAIIEPMLPKHHMGRPQKDLRAHFNGILWIARSGARWEDLPARYGPHQTVYSCFCRWRDDGTLERIFHALGANAELEELSIDSTTSKVSEQASRGPRKRLKRDRLYWTDPWRKEHQRFKPWSIGRGYLFAYRCLPVTAPTAMRQSLFCRSLEKSKGSNILGDRRYGAKKIRLFLAEQGAQYTIPPTRICFTPGNMTRKLTSAGM